ncbi:MAG TPA: glycosyltransferase [Candidatus Omnitrophota bacterium]|nr:glycosyltransferase [Candidatus Omnitrophota bacterium]MDD5270855.1 glycosyltransferase [Candidatus Omnitrophota bacterium]MDD5737088.1 glycosyltransferase [Candidatus Omnitrophota bacterium]HPN66441.1 glycosyltransferase [Candidatus Omnitrophota bacterium]HRZ67569.1 glycosyltransferase [Candidatus Omnitrophota bacterium]
MAKIDEYIPVVGQPQIDDLRLLADKLRGKVIQNINSTSVGGGVAEILSRMVPMLKELGVDARWDFIKGGERFFEATKKFHNALHGVNVGSLDGDFDVFLETSRSNIEELNTYGDVVFVHDPQPIALVDKKAGNKWIWRCHVDVSEPDKRVWDFLRGYIDRYDAAVFSAPAFSQKLPVRQFLISPSIDPLSDKNKELPQETIDAVLEKYGIPKDKPIVTQISRFDRLKDPLGVIQVYKQVKRYSDCRLVLAGGGASDDPESAEVLLEVKEAAKGDPDIHILLLAQNDIEINALQRASTVIMQKSLREGFGLTVSEALWKAKPVVASNVGGIPLQIAHKYSGLLCHSIEGAGFSLKQLLHSPDYARKLGENGKEHVKNNFLITRHLKEYMLLFLSLYHPEDIVYL